MYTNQNTINIYGARERNLKNISVSIPKKKITVFTGISGSGKSSLVFDTIAAESQRQLNDTYNSFVRSRLPQYGQPSVDRIENLPVSFVINQKRIGGNSRSTVGTITDIYSLLRLLYSRIGTPFVGYAEAFSFNSPAGMCEACDGLGTIDQIDTSLLLDMDKSLNQGAILFPGFSTDGWRIRRYLHCGLFDNNKKLRDYTQEELDLLLYKDDYKLPNPDPEYPQAGIYEGVIPRIQRSFLSGKGEERKRYSMEIDKIVTHQNCPSCGGSRLNKTIRSCKIHEKSIADCTTMQIDELLHFLRQIHHPTAATILSALIQQLEQMVSLGLGYLSLGRDTPTLSGGESQRIKMVKQLGSSLCDILYIFDEPSIGLHPYNVDKISRLMELLRDKGNTVLIVEHDPDLIKIADHVIDMGPYAGSSGGQVVFQGSYPQLKQADTLTARHLSHTVRLKSDTRPSKGTLEIKNASLHNLKNVSTTIPKSVLTVVTGVAGSGKSSLINGVLTRTYPECICIDQKSIQASKRSNLATFTGIFDRIRSLFARSTGKSAALFSFNSKGACPTCKGLGKIYTDLAFMDTIVQTCDVCEGMQYTPDVLSYTLDGKNIHEVLSLTPVEALSFFDDADICSVLTRLIEVGLDYLTLGQSLDTLSGGELQRVKLAAELEKRGNLYILDEPTTGLHPSDIDRLMNVLNKLVDQGNTVIVIEHNLDVIAGADWIIDIGPQAGQNGGTIVFEGPPVQLIHCDDSITARYLKKYIK